MKASDERILTTHAGSLPRTTALTDLLIRREQGKPFEQAEFDREVDRALDVAVGKQLVCGLDIGNDGEMPRIGFSTYAADRDYVMGVARELKKEYDYVVSHGYVLQIDAPDLAMERVIMFAERPLADFLERVELHVEAMNLALADIPPEKVRLHVCWGNWQGPHQDDVPVEELLPILYRAKVGALSIPLGNPRHEHETAAFKKLPLPDDMVFIPGVIDVTTNYLEHPELVANRICAAVEAIGERSRVIAGTDCGFGTFASYEFVANDVAWGKLGALVEGAAIATQRLWGRPPAH